MDWEHSVLGVRGAPFESNHSENVYFVQIDGHASPTPLSALKFGTLGSAIAGSVFDGSVFDGLQAVAKLGKLSHDQAGGL
jgi:hypothetical protein